jgi:hypothetical protein
MAERAGEREHVPGPELRDAAAPKLTRPDSLAQLGREAGNDVVQRALATPGVPLDAALRQDFELALRADLRDVRVHTGAAAADSAEALSARAYTLGNEIVLGSDASEDAAGRETLAHEAIHVVQQERAGDPGGAAPAQLEVSSPDSPGEREAAVGAELLAAGDTPTVEEAPSADVMRQEEEAGTPGPPASPRRPAPSAPTPLGVSERADPGGPFLTYDDDTLGIRIELAESEPPTRATLAQLVARYGPREVAALVRRLSNAVASWGYSELRDPSGTPEDYSQRADYHAFQQRVVETAKRVLDEFENFLREFELQATDATRALLDASEAIVLREQKRYGIQIHATAAEAATPEAERREAWFTIEPTAETGQLIEAVAELRAKQAEIAELNQKREEAWPFHALPTPIPEPGPYSIGTGSTPADRRLSEYWGYTALLENAQREYQIMRERHERAFPIVASLLERPRQLGFVAEQKGKPIPRISSGVGLEDVLGQRIWEPLSSVRSVRRELGRRFSPLKHPTIVSFTKQVVGVAPGSEQDLLVQGRVAEPEEPSAVARVLEVVGWALMIVSVIPTGGASLALAGFRFGLQLTSAALTTYQTVEDIKRYQLALAATRTDFDKARALSQDDPSFFWLALELVALPLEFKALSAEFRELRAAYLAAQAEREAALAGKAAQKLKAKANALKPGLGDKLAASIEATYKTKKSVRPTVARTPEMELALEDRRWFLEHRDELLKDPDIAAWYKIFEKQGGTQAELFGTLVADKYTREQLLPELVPGLTAGKAPTHIGRGSNTLDLAYEEGNLALVVESKAGKTELGYRVLPNGQLAQQGTYEYVKATLEIMRNNPAEKELAERLLKALNEKRLRYFLVDTPIPRPGQPIRPKVDEFNLKP